MGEFKNLGTDSSIKDQAGLLGFDDGVQSFGFNVDGSAFLGAPGKGRISFNGEYGYLMSGNFNGFGSKGAIPVFENGVEPDFNFNNATPEGVYIGLSSGNAYFAGTLYATEGKIGGWTIGNDILYAQNNSLYTTIKSNGSIAFATASPSSSTTTGAQVQIWHNGMVRLGYENNKYAVVIDPNHEKDKPLATFNGTIYATGGEIGGCLINNGKLEIPVANISGKLTANNIDATNLKVKAANITGTLTADQINGNGLSVSNATVSNLTIVGSSLTFGNSTLNTGYHNLAGGNILSISSGLYVNTLQFAYIVIPINDPSTGLGYATKKISVTDFARAAGLI